MLAVVKLGLILVALLVSLRCGAPLTWAMLGGSLGLAILFMLPALCVLRIAWGAVVSPETVTLALAVGLIMLLDGLLRESGLMKGLVRSLLGLFGDRRPALAALPALIGFLPSAAWARFLAPVVEEVCAGSGADASRQAFIAYWYQHVTVYVSPLFPSLVLAAHLAGLPPASVIVALVPVAATALLAGAPIAFRLGAADRSRVEAREPRGAQALGLAKGLLPILSVVGLVLLGVNIAVALLAVAAALAMTCRLGPGRLADVARRAVVPEQILTVVAIMAFKDMLLGTGALQEIPQTLAGVGAPALAVVLGIAFFAALLTGGSQAGIAMALPPLVRLPEDTTADLVALVFVWTLSGLMLSPAHMCLGLTREHFRARFGPVQRLLIVPQGLVAAGATAIYLLVTRG